jgi:hypothetical protein
MPLSLVDWLPEDHLAWFILDLAGELDLAELCLAASRWPGWGAVSLRDDAGCVVLRLLG